MELKNELVVHCNTEEKAKKFLMECHKQGIKWASGSSIFHSETYMINIPWLYGKNTVYYLDNGKLSCGNIHYAPKDKVISFDDLLKTTEKKKCKIYTKPKFMNDDVAKVIVNEPCVIVYLDNGEKGVAECCPEDEFNEELGYEIAYQRATIEKLKNEVVKAEKYLRYLV